MQGCQEQLCAWPEAQYCCYWQRCAHSAPSLSSVELVHASCVGLF